MKLSKQELADIFDDAADFDGNNEQAFDARKALEDGTLEIEDYERVKWIKFDPNNERTHPGMRTRVLVWLDNNIFCGRFRDFEVEFSRYGEGVKTVYWRIAPKPPTETKEQNY